MRFRNDLPTQDWPPKTDDLLPKGWRRTAIFAGCLNLLLIAGVLALIVAAIWFVVAVVL